MNPRKPQKTIGKPLTWLILAELLLASRISGVSGITWMEVLSAFQASVYKCYGGSEVSLSLEPIQDNYFQI